MDTELEESDTFADVEEDEDELEENELVLEDCYIHYTMLLQSLNCNYMRVVHVCTVFEY